jgi:hypothetical protein
MVSIASEKMAMDPVSIYAVHFRASIRKPIKSEIFIALDSALDG